MKLREFFLLIGKSVTPGAYKDLVLSSMKQTCAYFLGVLSLAFLITILLYVPVLTDLSFNLNKGLSKLTKLNIDVSLETSEPIQFKSLGIAIDTTGKITNLTEEKVLVTDKHIMIGSTKCLLFKPLCSFSKDKVKTISLEPKNLIQYKNDVISVATTLILLLIPTILVSFYLMYLIKYVIIILIVSTLTFLLTRIRLYEVRLLKIVKLATYTITPMVFIEVINLRFMLNLHLIPLIIFAILFTIGIMLIGEKAIKHKET